VISFLIGIIIAAVVFYMSMIYGNAALALLGCFMCVFMVLTFIALLVKAHRAVAAINIPIAIATQGESIRVSLSCRLKEAGFDGVKYRVTVKNNLSGEKSTKWLSGGSDFLYSVNLCGNYEFELVRIKLYDFSRLFYVTKRVKKYANVEVMPQIDEIPVRITDRVRNFFGDSDIYDDLRPGYDPSELFDVRILLEPEVAATACRNATEEDKKRIKELCDEVEQLYMAGKNHIQKDMEFHEAIAKCSGNRVVEVLIPVILTAITTFANLTNRKLQKETIETHRKITEAIVRGDGMGAKCAMIMHLTYNRQTLIEMSNMK